MEHVHYEHQVTCVRKETKAVAGAVMSSACRVALEHTQHQEGFGTETQADFRGSAVQEAMHPMHKKEILTGSGLDQTSINHNHVQEDSRSREGTETQVGFRGSAVKGAMHHMHKREILAGSGLDQTSINHNQVPPLLRPQGIS